MKRTVGLLIVLCIAVAAATFAITALLMNIQTRKAEGHETYVKLVELTEETEDPAVWGQNFPREYDGYKRTSDIERTRYGGSEALSKLDTDPRLLRIFSGYAFGIDYREERGHAYSLSDQEETKRVTEKKQPGACIHCHASVLPAYRAAGDGDVMAGFEKVNALPYEEARKLVTHPIVCLDCHDPQTMELRVTRPGFINGIREYMKTKGIENYDPNTMATRQEMRSYVCGQCHVEYYFAPPNTMVTYPWKLGLKVEQIYDYYQQVGHKDWTHKETGAPVLKAQHPEFEMWNQSVHARANVACADCHMPYMREGALKVSDHHIRSPLLNIERACLVCHPFSASEMEARVFTIQDRNAALLGRAEDALVQLYDEVNAARAAGIADDKLEEVWELQRRAQFYTDFVNAENSMGFHAPQEAARILGEAIDYARQGQLKAAELRGGLSPAPSGSPAAKPEEAKPAEGTPPAGQPPAAK